MDRIRQNQPDTMQMEKLKQANRISMEILELAKSFLLVHLRYMDRAIDRLAFQLDLEEFRVDGNRIYYNPRQVLQTYKQNKNAVSRKLLHMIFHCIFCHHLPDYSRDPVLWDLACDLAVENSINELELVQLDIAEASAQKKVLEKLKKEVPLLTAEKIYAYFTHNRPDEKTIEQLYRLFYTDNHEHWFAPVPPEPQEAAPKNAGAQTKKVLQPEPGTGSCSQQEPEESDENEQNSSEGNGSDQNNDSSPEDEQGSDDQDSGSLKDDSNPEDEQGYDDQNSGSLKDDSSQGKSEDRPDSSGSSSGLQDFMEPDELPEEPGQKSLPVSQSSYGGYSARDEQEDFWKSVSQEMEIALETIFKAQGKDAGSLIQSLKAVNREKWDYTEFLRQFSVSHESVKVNEDEFDYIYYTLGLHNYGNMPLVEPLEYKEDKRIEEFVIALDTSGSVQGEQVQRFVQKTWNILKSEETFFKRINIHIIQCDTEIQSDVKITSQEEFDSFIHDLKLYGFGGTDFRPVFSYIDELIEQKEFKNLKGMIYFTDGYGTFPNRVPAYKTAFVFVEEGYAIPSVPAWAIRLILAPEDLDTFEPVKVLPK